MKKIALILSVLVVLNLFCGCTAKKEEFEEPVNFYFGRKEIAYNSPSGVIQAELREGASFHNNLTACLRTYMLGPASSHLQRLIPADVYLVSCQLEEETAAVVMSSQFSELSGLELSTACSALLMTIHDYSGVQTLKISAKDALVNDEDEFVLSMDDIVVLDTVKG